ncbi:ABC transporter ATP-binding protein [Desulfobulbus sp.]|uniref:ABC transporter ATP-binding protein n=1 Tax=Desulfobulbus sp. TaxID=895 RepID=UPI00286F1EC8|nr:ABC transporter ATP-binding protein [Desulfobulbus sp.]
MSATIDQPVIEACDLSVGYKNRPVARHLNFSCHAGQFISLLGPNGAGKTTLLRTLSRHLPPQGGGVRVQGRSLESLSAMELARIMAVVLTDKIAPPLFTVFEFVALGRYPHTDYLGRLGTRDRVAVTSSLAAVHALDLANRPFADLSDGERQKVLMARALAQDPRVLLLDEPTIHLDLKHRVEVMAILRDLCRNKGITVIASLHDVDIAAKVSDRVALIRDGGIVAWDTPETALSRQAVTALYDFDKAEFNRHLGGIELRGAGDRGRAFVVGGMGSGALIYRMLTKKGFTIATGVVHENDLDCFVARSLGAECVAVGPMEPIDNAAVDRAKTLLAACDLVVDCGFPVGPVNEANLALMQAALERGATMLSLRDGLPPGLRVNKGDTPVLFTDAGHLIEALETFQFHRPLPVHGEEVQCIP